MRVEERELSPFAAPAPEPPESRRVVSRVAPWAVAALLGAWAVAASLTFFPDLTNNNDEAVYLLQADALRRGYLFPPAPTSWEAFLPWFSFHDGGRFVLKYTPVHAAILAAAGFLFGTERAGLLVIGAAAAASAYLLALQVLRDRRVATLAAALFALSPLVLLQSATFLSYLSALALLQLFAAALIVGVRRRSPRWLTGAGLLLGLAIFARPFDALLFAVPICLWAVWMGRHDLRAAASTAAWVALGAIPPVVAMLAFFYAATGSPFDPPFDIDASDTLGFGPKSMTPGGLVTEYTPELAIAGLRGNLSALVEWSFGGLALVVLAAAGLRRLRPRDPAPWLALICLSIPVGYLFFWGSYGTVRWGGPDRLGPHYYLPLLTPLAILGARGLSSLWRRTRTIAALTAVAMLAFSASTVVEAIGASRPYVEGRKELYRPLPITGLQNALVFLPYVGAGRLASPYALARNDASYAGPVIWAVDRGTRLNLEVLEEFPGRTPYRLVASRGRRKSAAPKPNFDTKLQRVVKLGGEEVDLELRVVEPDGGFPVRLILSAEGARMAVDVPAGAVRKLPLTIGPGYARVQGQTFTPGTTGKSRLRLKISAVTLDGAGTPAKGLGTAELDVAVDPNGVRVLAPAEAPDVEPGRPAVYLVTPDSAGG